MPGVYVFPSESKRNIMMGIKAGKWAVPMQKSKASVIGKARSMVVGDPVLLYLNGEKDLYGLFRVTETPDRNRVVSDLWDGKYELPFGIELSVEQERVAILHAPRLMKVLPSLRQATGAWSVHFQKFRGMTIFQQQPLSEEDMTAFRTKFLELSRKPQG